MITPAYTLQRPGGLAVSAGRRSRRISLSLKPRLAVVAPSKAEVVGLIGGWVFDHVMSGWEVTVLTPDDADDTPLRILGARCRDLDAMLAAPLSGACLQAIVVQVGLFDADERVREMVRRMRNAGPTETIVRADWQPPQPQAGIDRAYHQLSWAAEAFKGRAMDAVGIPPDYGESAWKFRVDATASDRFRPFEVADRSSMRQTETEVGLLPVDRTREEADA